MSPRRANSITVRDNLIRNLAPMLMRAVNVRREVALELLATLSPDERYFLYCLRARGMGLRTRKKEVA